MAFVTRLAHLHRHNPAHLKVTMGVRLIFGAMILAGCGDLRDGHSPEPDISGVYAFDGEAQSTSGVSGTCRLSGTLALTQAGTSASGTFDGLLICSVADLGQESEIIESELVQGIRVDGNGMSWNAHNCELSGEFQGANRIEGDITCTKTYIDVPVNIEGTWQMSQ